MRERPPVTPQYMRDWGRHAASSPLYHHLVEVIAEDEELLRVMNRVLNRPPPNILFGAVHFLLLRGADHPLAAFYGSLVASPRQPEKSGADFRDFVLAHEEEIVRVGRQRYTQTNECRRCVILLPGVMAAGLRRFHLIEIGASAGLNLAIDRYRYSWGDLEWGPDSTLRLETELRGSLPAVHSLQVLRRIGLDLNPIDATDPDDRDWLVALIWPEHTERRERLELALEIAAELDIEQVAGDAVHTLSPALADLPPGDPVVVMDSFSLNQFSPQARDELDRAIEEERGRREIARVSLIPTADDVSALLRVDAGDGWTDLGRSQHHGEWVEFYARP